MTIGDPCPSLPLWPPVWEKGGGGGVILCANEVTGSPDIIKEYL